MTIRVHEGHIIHTVRDGAHPLITFDGLPGDPYALQVHPSGRFYPYQGVRGFPVVQCVEESEVPINLQWDLLLTQAGPVFTQMIVR